MYSVRLISRKNLYVVKKSQNKFNSFNMINLKIKSEIALVRKSTKLNSIFLIVKKFTVYKMKKNAGKIWEKGD